MCLRIEAVRKRGGEKNELWLDMYPKTYMYPKPSPAYIYKDVYWHYKVLSATLVPR